MQQPVDSSLSFYERAIEWTHRADKVVNLVLGYLLAIASVLGFMDVLSNGEVLQYASWLFYVWLGIMGLGVDFQILLVIGRIPDLFRVEGKKKWIIFGFNVAFLLLLCYMSVVIGAIFVQHKDVPGTVAEAMNALGISGVAFVYERAALATLLLVLMAVDRTMERWRLQQEHVVTDPVPAQEHKNSISDETVQLLLSKLAKLDALEHQLTTHQVTVIEPVEEEHKQIAGPGENESEPNETIGETSETDIETIMRQQNCSRATAYRKLRQVRK